MQRALTRNQIKSALPPRFPDLRNDNHQEKCSQVGHHLAHAYDPVTWQS